VHLGVLSGSEVIYLDKVEGRQMVRMHSQIGNASPLYCTGVGKAALSALPDEEVERRIASLRFHVHTPTTLRDADALRREIAAIRQTGVAYDREEHEPGIHCVAAPIHSPNRDFVAGVSVTAPAYRMPMTTLEEWEPLVRGCAQGIMEDMASRLGPRS
jgi:DNA-binding IclR family transcriptional regulator